MNLYGYDNIPKNDSILLDLPVREGVGIITQDIAKPHHPMTLNDPGGGSFSWGALASGLTALEFVTAGSGFTDGVYIDSPAAETADLNFTSGDFSLAAWINWAWNGQSSIMLGRYGINLDGWETFLDISGGLNTLSHRHHHSSLAPNNNSSCFSTGWTPGAWAFLGISREGGNLFPLHYRNGKSLTMTYESSGMLDPDSCNRDLVVGCRYTKDANWFKGKMWRPRIWERALPASEWAKIFNHEKSLFGL